MTAKQIRETIQAHLLRGDVGQALNSLLSILVHSNHRREHENVLMLKAQWEGIRQEHLKSLLSRPEYESAVNKIIAGIQAILNDIDNNQEGAAAPIIQNHTSSNKRMYLLIGLSAVLLLGGVYYFTQINRSPVHTAASQDITVQKGQQEQPTSGTKTSEEKPAPTGSPEKKTTPAVAKPQREQVSTSAEPVPPKPKESPQAAPVTIPTIETKMIVSKIIETKMIVSKSDVKIKIDGQMPNYVGSSTGIVRTIQIKEGNHKFEIIENGSICTVEIMISKNLSKIYPTCR